MKKPSEAGLLKGFVLCAEYEQNPAPIASTFRKAYVFYRERLSIPRVCSTVYNTVS